MRNPILFFAFSMALGLSLPSKAEKVAVHLAPETFLKETAVLSGEDVPLVEEKARIWVHRKLLDSAGKLGFQDGEEFRRFLENVLGSAFSGEVHLQLSEEALGKPSLPFMHLISDKKTFLRVPPSVLNLSLGEDPGVDVRMRRAFFTMACLNHAGRIQAWNTDREVPVLAQRGKEEMESNECFLRLAFPELQSRPEILKAAKLFFAFSIEGVQESPELKLIQPQFGKALALAYAERFRGTKGVMSLADQRTIMALLDLDYQRVAGNPGEIPSKIYPLHHLAMEMMSAQGIATSSRGRLLSRWVHWILEKRKPAPEAVARPNDADFWYLGQALRFALYEPDLKFPVLEELMEDLLNEKDYEALYGVLQSVRLTPETSKEISEFIFHFFSENRSKLDIPSAEILSKKEYLFWETFCRDPLLQEALLKMPPDQVRKFWPYVDRAFAVRYFADWREGRSGSRDARALLMEKVAQEQDRGSPALSGSRLLAFSNQKILYHPPEILLAVLNFLSSLEHELLQDEGPRSLAMRSIPISAEALVGYAKEGKNPKGVLFERWAKGWPPPASKPESSWDWQNILSTDARYSFFADLSDFFENQEKNLEDLTRWESRFNALPLVLADRLEAIFPVRATGIEDLREQRLDMEKLVSTLNEMLAQSPESKPSLEDLWELNETLSLIREEIEAFGQIPWNEKEQLLTALFKKVEAHRSSFSEQAPPLLRSMLFLGTQILLSDVREVMALREDFLAAGWEEGRVYTQQEIQERLERDPSLKPSLELLFEGIPTGFRVRFDPTGVVLGMDHRTFAQAHGPSDLSQYNNVMWGGSYEPETLFGFGEWGSRGLTIVEVMGARPSERRKVTERHEMRHLQTDRYFKDGWKRIFYSSSDVIGRLKSVENPVERERKALGNIRQNLFTLAHDEMVSYTAEGFSSYKHLESLMYYWNNYRQAIEKVLSVPELSSFKESILERVKKDYLETHRLYGERFPRVLKRVMESLAHRESYFRKSEEEIRLEACERIASLVRLVPFDRAPSLLLWIEKKLRQESEQWKDLGLQARETRGHWGLEMQPKSAA